VWDLLGNEQRPTPGPSADAPACHFSGPGSLRRSRGGKSSMPSVSPVPTHVPLHAPASTTPGKTSAATRTTDGMRLRLKATMTFPDFPQTCNPYHRHEEIWLDPGRQRQPLYVLAFPTAVGAVILDTLKERASHRFSSSPDESRLQRFEHSFGSRPDESPASLLARQNLPAEASVTLAWAVTNASYVMCPQGSVTCEEVA